MRPGPEVGKASWTAPQKQVAVAESSLEKPSFAEPASGMYGLVLSAVAAMIREAGMFSDLQYSPVGQELLLLNCRSGLKALILLEEEQKQPSLIENPGFSNFRSSCRIQEVEPSIYISRSSDMRSVSP